VCVSFITEAIATSASADPEEVFAVFGSKKQLTASILLYNTNRIIIHGIS
jgi:hypothetical protein